MGDVRLPPQKQERDERPGVPLRADGSGRMERRRGGLPGAEVGGWSRVGSGERRGADGAEQGGGGIATAPRLTDGARFWYSNPGWFVVLAIHEIFRLDDEIIFPVDV